MYKAVVLYSLYGLFSLYVSLADIKTGFIPRPLMLWAIVFFIILKSLFFGVSGFRTALLGGLAGSLVFLGVFFWSRKKLGLADVWYACIMGVILGPFRWYQAISAACAAGLCFMILFRRRSVPFIPFMAAGNAALLAWRLLAGSYGQ
jgi:prepilin signal peptidase PulO-like enzyme (type II secretory pathway)